MSYFDLSKVEKGDVVNVSVDVLVTDVFENEFHGFSLLHNGDRLQFLSTYDLRQDRGFTFVHKPAPIEQFTAGDVVRSKMYPDLVYALYEDGRGELMAMVVASEYKGQIGKTSTVKSSMTSKSYERVTL